MELNTEIKISTDPIFNKISKVVPEIEWKIYAPLIHKINKLKKEKKNLVLNLMVLIMINLEEKRDLVFKIEENQKIHLNSKNKDITEGAKIELFKMEFGAARQTRTVTGIPHLALNQACLPIPT